MYIANVYSTRTNKLIARFFSITREGAEIPAREKLFNHNKPIKSRVYRIFKMKKWRARKLKNCCYKGKKYNNIYLQMYTDYEGAKKINITCEGANMNDFISVKEAFSHITKNI